MPEKLSGTVLAFDFGLLRTGVAVGEIEIGITHPLETIKANSKEELMLAIDVLYKQWQPKHMVVGLPTHADGTSHELTECARKFSRRLNGRFASQIWLIDERYTSELAETMLEEAGVYGYKKQKSALDQVAAQAILATWFELSTNDKIAQCCG